MYNADQYQRAKAQLATADKASPKYAEVKAKVSEYERYNPSHNAPVEGAHAQSGEELAGASPPKAVEPKLSHESDPTLAASTAAKAADPWQTAESVPDIEDRTRDEDLPNASKLKTLNTPPEYVAQNPMAGLAHIAKASLATGLAEGSQANSYYEPTYKQFLEAQRPILEAQGVAPGSEREREQFDEWKDRKWAQAYEQAKAEDRPLTRMEYIDHQANRGAWDKLKDTLVNTVDAASAFGKGFLAGKTLQASRLAPAALDYATGSDRVGDDEAQAERNPVLSFLGEMKGATSGPLNEITKESTIAGDSTSMEKRIGGAAVGGAVAGEYDNAARSLATGAGDLAHGRGTENAKDQFESHLLGSGLIGGGFGAAGQVVAEGANALQKATLANTPELGQLRRGGGDTDLYRGIRPGAAVKENIEAAREPLPSEAKESLGATPVEVGANKIREPLAQAHTDSNAETYARLGAEKQAAVAADPNLQKPVPARNAAQAAVDWVKSKLQPEVKAGYLPGMKLTTPETTPGADTAEATKLVQQLYKPRLVTSVEAQNAARANGGVVIDAADAQKLGIDVGNLGHALDETGVPDGAPSADEGVSIPKILPKFPKGTDAGGVAANATPEEIAAVRRYTFGAPAEKVGPSPVDRLKPRPGRAFKTPTGPVGSDWFDKEKAAETVALHSGDYEVQDPFAAQRSQGTNSPAADTPTAPENAAPSLATPSVRPSTPPPELRATPSPAAAQGMVARLPTSHFKVVLEPREYDAQKFEDILGDIDRKAGYAKATGAPDPQWEKLAQAIREDRKQFGPEWSDMIAKHHEELNGLEQRSFRAGMAQDKAYQEMSGNAQSRLQGKLKGFPGDVDSNEALRQLADEAGVSKELEELGATNVYGKLKGQANPKLGETLGAGGISGHLRGIGPSVRFRADAVARGLSAGPTGEPTITPKLAAFLGKSAPVGPKWLPGVPAVGGGALGQKAAVAYNELTPAQRQYLDKLVAAAKHAVGADK